MRTLSYRNLPKRQRGVSLLEVLIAVLVLAIGILGVAALQATALRNNQGAAERTQAVIQTYTILDAMRANRDAALRGEYDMDWRPCEVPADASTRANREKQIWMQQLKAFNPTACGLVQRRAGTDQFVIGIRWDDRREGQADAEPQQLETVGGV